jgi:hypothetical protein
VGHTITQMPDEPIIVATFTNPFDPVKDAVPVAGYLLEHLKNTTGRVYYIADMSGLKINFSDLVQGMSQAFTDPNSPYVNPRLATFTVAGDTLISVGVKAAAEQQRYGKANIKLYRSINQAMSEIRKQMAKS